ncbi:hypothetical protein [Spiroplasma endosymbiont of Atherix ibis]|uniref:hypothetical protein n=1 Tax=Spiroplasma endosymbiont of Atherix ibis TaxID=3066291 RepID=UPI0030CF4D7D
MFKKNKKVINSNSKSDINYEITINSWFFKFYSIQEITKQIILETTEEIRLSDDYGKSNSYKKFLLSLEDEFTNFFSLWKENFWNSKVLEIKTYSKISNLIPIIRPWKKMKYDEVPPNSEARKKRIKAFSNPLEKEGYPILGDTFI